MPTRLMAIGYQPDWWAILTSPFMRNALVGGTLVALAAGLIGYFIVVRNNAFAAHALAHIGFPGATGAVLVGLPVTAGLAVFCIGGALVIGALGKRADEREIATGTVLAAATGLGLFFSSLTNSQIVAAVTTIVSSLALWLVSFFRENASKTLQFLAWFSMLYHHEDFWRGVISLQEVVWYCSAIYFLLFASKLMVASSRWR